MKNNFMERGASALEALIGLVLAAPLMLMVGTGVHSALVHYLRIRVEHQNQYALIKTEGLLEKLMQGLDSHAFTLPLRIHKAGNIVMTNGEPNRVLSSKKNPPDLRSDAITGIALEITASYGVVRFEQQPWWYVFYACPRFDRRLHPEEFKSFVGISPDGPIELRGTYLAHPGNAECLDFELAPVESMSVVAGDLLGAEHIKDIIPVSRHHTFYVDQQQQLRLLSHRGAENVENQPLLRGVQSLKLSMEGVFGGSVSALSAEVKFVDGRNESFTLVHKLGQSSYYNFLMNRP
ncbi:MAG: hypothetical protein GX589_02060 [Deltaproteobacteria bacterium]|nr:hypothetical protein [Deltaproteobacteria bacterium]